MDALTTQEKYPFSTSELRDEIRHSFWLLNRVASAKALERMLKKHPVFTSTRSFSPPATADPTLTRTTA